MLLSLFPDSESLCRVLPRVVPLRSFTGKSAADKSRFSSNNLFLLNGNLTLSHWSRRMSILRLFEYVKSDSSSGFSTPVGKIRDEAFPKMFEFLG